MCLFFNMEQTSVVYKDYQFIILKYWPRDLWIYQYNKQLSILLLKTL